MTMVMMMEALFGKAQTKKKQWKNSKNRYKNRVKWSITYE